GPVHWRDSSILLRSRSRRHGCALRTPLVLLSSFPAARRVCRRRILMRRLARSSGASAALAGLLAAGVLVRAWMMATWQPAVVGYYDTVAYVRAAQAHLFTDEFRPAGYPALLRTLHAVGP